MVEPRDGRSLDIVTFNSGDEVIEVLHVHGNTDCEFLLSDSNRKWTVDNRATLSCGTIVVPSKGYFVSGGTKSKILETLLEFLEDRNKYIDLGLQKRKHMVKVEWYDSRD